MYAVIFRARIRELDDVYESIASHLRELAINQYGCLEFTGVTEGKEEIVISYWQTEEDILAWKNNAEHKRAQALGRERWYESYSVEVVEIQRQYRN